MKAPCSRCHPALGKSRAVEPRKDANFTSCSFFCVACGRRVKKSEKA